MNTLTIEEIKEHYDVYMSEGLSHTFPQYLTAILNATKKVVDLAYLVESGIDCTHDLFEGYGPFADSWTAEDLIKYRVVPRTKYIHSWQGGDNPFPEGFIVKVWFRDGSPPVSDHSYAFEWSHCAKYPDKDIIHFEVHEVLADGWVMPWGEDT